MFKRKILFAVLVLLVAIVSTSKMMGQDIVKNFSNKDFQNISISNAIQCQITQSDNYSIEIKADERDFKYLKVDQNGSALKIFIDKNNYDAYGEIKVKITMPELTEINCSGASKCKLSMNVPGKEFEANLSGSSKVNLNGKGSDLDLQASGSSSMKMKNFSVNNADVQMSGSSSAELNLNGKLNTKQSGSSKIVYYGNVDLGETSFSGSSGIKKGE